MKKDIRGSLRNKDGVWQMVFSYYDDSGIRRQKSRSTGLPVKNNKRKAEEMLAEALDEFQIPQTEERLNPKPETEGDMMFSDYMRMWLGKIKNRLTKTTYSSYQLVINYPIGPYFDELNKRLKDITSDDIQDFYEVQLERVSPKSVVNYHARIHSCLKYAVKQDHIFKNPMDKVEKPKYEKYIGEYYNDEQLKKLFEIVSGTKIELPVLFGAYYGLRRGEVIGLKWNAIDLKNETLTIRHTVTVAYIDGAKEVVEQNRAKNKSSLRTLPLMPVFKEILIKLQKEQEENRRVARKSYNSEHMGYIFVNELGTRMDPDYLTKAFRDLIVQNNLTPIRFHDLRHSCASLLFANGVPIMEIANWMGHSDIGTTGNIYGHLDFSSKITSAQTISHALGSNNVPVNAD